MVNVSVKGRQVLTRFCLNFLSDAAVTSHSLTFVLLNVASQKFSDRLVSVGVVQCRTSFP